MRRMWSRDNYYFVEKILIFVFVFIAVIGQITSYYIIFIQRTVKNVFLLQFKTNFLMAMI